LSQIVDGQLDDRVDVVVRTEDVLGTVHELESDRHARGLVSGGQCLALSVRHHPVTRAVDEEKRWG
jgi:hypothetical protein